MVMQTQLLQGIAAILQNQHQNPPPNQNMPPPQMNHGAYPPPLPPRDKRGEFLKGRPPRFFRAADPMEAVDFLKEVEKQLVIAQCTDREMVLYGSGQLCGSAQSWWEEICFASQHPENITWDEFKKAFEKEYVPAGLVKLKKEFSELKQGTMSVCEYRDKFTELSRYAPDEVKRDEDK